MKTVPDFFLDESKGEKLLGAAYDDSKIYLLVYNESHFSFQSTIWQQ